MARQLEQTIILKAAGSLRGELECAAKEAGVSLSALVRKILIEWCSERVAERGDVAGTGPVLARPADFGSTASTSQRTA